MHDLFHILGVPAGAGSQVIRRASDRRMRRWHPDLDAGRVPRGIAAWPPQDLAIDFVDMSSVVDRIHAAFFHAGR